MCSWVTHLLMSDNDVLTEWTAVTLPNTECFVISFTSCKCACYTNFNDIGLNACNTALIYNLRYRVTFRPEIDVTSSDRYEIPRSWFRFQGHGVTTDSLDVLCAQLTSDLFAIAKFLVLFCFTNCDIVLLLGSGSMGFLNCKHLHSVRVVNAATG